MILRFTISSAEFGETLKMSRDYIERGAGERGHPVKYLPRKCDVAFKV